MALGNVDIQSAMRRLADQRIEEAMREGKFDNLPGKGKPIELEPIPADEKARMTWWCLRIMKTNGFTPEEVQWRKQLDLLKEQLSQAKLPAKIARLVNTINALVRRINTLGTNALSEPVAPVSLDAELQRKR